MPSDQTVHYRSRNSNLKTSCEEIEGELKAQQDALRISLRACAEPVVQLADSCLVLTTQNRSHDIPKLTSLVRSIAADFDTFSKERTLLDTRYEKLVENRPTKKSHLSRHSTDAMLLGHAYITLNERVINTLLRSVDDYHDILKPATTTEAAL